MCHGSDVLPGQSAISDSDLLLDSTFCEKNKQVSQFFGTVCLLSSPTGMDQMSHSASQRFRTQIYCWTVPSVKKTDFPVFLYRGPTVQCRSHGSGCLTLQQVEWLRWRKNKQNETGHACVVQNIFSNYMCIFFSGALFVGANHWHQQEKRTTPICSIFPNLVDSKFTSSHCDCLIWFWNLI